MSTVKLAARPTGIGIANEHQDLIFQEFFQVGNLSRDQKKGLGLGLSIVSKTAALLGHRIEVQSVAGKGTVFSVEVPISDLRTKDTKHEVPKQVPMLLNQPFVVVIEDNVDVQDSIKVLLESWGCHVLAVPCVERDEMIRCQAKLVGSDVSPETAAIDLRPLSFSRRSR